MRVRTTRLLGVLAIGGTMLSSTACLPGLDTVDKTAACTAMVAELNSVASRASQNLTDPAATAQVYSDAATKIRSEGQKAGGDVQSAADNVAADLDELAQALREAANGTPRIPDTSGLVSSGAQLRTACTS